MSVVGEVLVPVLVHPRRARAAAAVHEQLDAARQQPPSPSDAGGRGFAFDAREHLRGPIDRARAGPQREHAHGQLAFLRAARWYSVPLRLADARILGAGHAFRVEVLDDLDDAVLLLLARAAAGRAA